jgi:transcriptional regulator with XRE-family HTH domain
MIEQRERTDPHYSTLEKLAGALEMSVAELVEGQADRGKVLAQ